MSVHSQCNVFNASETQQKLFALIATSLSFPTTANIHGYGNVSRNCKFEDKFHSRIQAHNVYYTYGQFNLPRSNNECFYAALVSRGYFLSENVKKSPIENAFELGRYVFRRIFLHNLSSRPAYIFHYHQRGISIRRIFF